MHNTIIRPYITEHSVDNVSKGKYTFLVAKEASKNTIKHAVEKAFSVKVLSVSTMIVKGRTKRTGMRRTQQKESSWKKATVQLPKEQKIALFDLGGK